MIIEFFCKYELIILVLVHLLLVSLGIIVGFLTYSIKICKIFDCDTEEEMFTKYLPKDLYKKYHGDKQ